MKMRYCALLILLALLLGGCGFGAKSPTPPADGPAEPGLDESPLPAPVESPLTGPIESPLPAPARPPVAVISAAMNHLSAELDVATGQITLLSTEPVEWPDASLGCPEPGMMYAQVVTRGYQLVFEVDGELYEVHTDESGETVVICASDSANP